MDVSFPVVNIPGASGGVGMTKLITHQLMGIHYTFMLQIPMPLWQVPIPLIN